MIDRINASQSPLVNKGKVTGDRPLNKPAGEDNTNIDSSSGSLSKAVEQMAQQGMPVDLSLIRSVTKAIANDQYSVDPMMIAEKMIAFDRPDADVS